MTAIPRPWLPLIADLNGHPLDGAPHIRDVYAPCADYEPVSTPTGNGPCNTDGHHLCRTCANFNRAGYDALKGRP